MTGQSRKPLIGGAALVVLAIIGLVADVAQIVSIRKEPLYIMLIIALSVIMVWSIAVLAGLHTRQPRPKRYWLALCSLVVAGVTLSATIIAIGVDTLSGSNGTSTQTQTDQTQEPPKSNSTTTAQLPAAWKATLWLKQGVDADTAQSKPAIADAAVGDIDLYLTYYGVLQTQTGFYSIESPGLCPTEVNSGRPAEVNISAQAGQQYCFTTSAGNAAWIQVLSADVINFDPSRRHVQLSIRVWP